MATPTYTLLDSVTLASSAASVTFSSIDQSYGDLRLVASGVAGVNIIKTNVNGDYAGNYYHVTAGGNGTGTGSGSGSGTYFVFHYYGSDDLYQIDFFDYSATDKHKSALSRLSDAGASVSMSANRWASTAAITSITMTASTGTFSAGATFHLYGIAKAL